MTPRVIHVATIEASVRGILFNKLIGLQKLGYDVEAVASGSGQNMAKLQEMGIDYYSVPMSRQIAPWADLLAIAKMQRLFRHLKPDIVHTHTAKAGFIGRMAARLARVPIIAHTVHGLPFYEGQSPLVYNLYKRLELFAAGQTDLLFSQNREDQKTLENLLNRKVVYEGNGIDIERFDGLSKVSEIEKRAELHIPDDKFVIGFFGRFEPVKGHSFFVRSIAELVKRYPEVLCLLAGGGPLEQRIREMVHAYELQENIWFLGYRRDVPELMKAIDVLVLPSRKEGIPRVVMEAMAAKKPVIATEVLGNREVVDHGETGYLFEWGNSQNFVAVMTRLIDNPSLKDKMGRAGRARLERYFDEKKCIQVIHQAYQEMLATKQMI